eukprot:TRINITY_DN12405_c0_g1_i6.p1 TRINITY_DN12405_c0_g1~~TRINITY_DN12405_c0_g1_i6.p1  ORF type:complete len:369 (-),score=76.18 TRINITY_DN12405_c0_g1_i6:360-1466(-)
MVQCHSGSDQPPETIKVHDAEGALQDTIRPGRIELDEENPLHFRYKFSKIGNASPPAPPSQLNLQGRLLTYLRGAPVEHPSLLHKCAAEVFGTFLIVLFGCGVVTAATVSSAQSGLWQVAAVWGFGVAIAIYCTASSSGAHLNPAISLAFALVRPEDFSWAALLPYWAAQLIGAILGGLVNLAAWNSTLKAFEDKRGISRGDSSSVLTAACFGEYFPNPGFQYSAATTSGDSPALNAALGWVDDDVTPAGAMLIEAWGTCVLAFVIFALTDPRNKVMVRKEMVPFFIGFTVAVLISIYAPLTQAGWNPARDFGPRLVAACTGWGEIAIPGPRNGFWVYIVGPMLGAPVGAGLHDFLISRGYGATNKAD